MWQVALHWVGDTGRALRDLVLLNLRKSWFRIVGPRGKSCCQAPGDSGLGGETRCMAVSAWHDQQRFQRVCPLLQHQAGRGWYCSVDRAKIRPFWGRAFSIYLLLGILGYGSAIGAVLCWWRIQEVPVTWHQVVWPPNWSQITSLRSDVYLREAREAVNRQQLDHALLLLQTAHTIDRSNYNAGILLAELLSFFKPRESDTLYRRLIVDHSIHTETTARSWLPSLLAREQYRTLHDLAKDLLTRAQTSNPGVWLQIYWFSLRQLPHPLPRPDGASLSNLVPTVHPELNLIDNVYSLNDDETGNLLLPLIRDSSKTPLEIYFASRILIERGHAINVLNALQLHRNSLSDRDYFELYSRVHVALGRFDHLRIESLQLLKSQPSDPVLELLCLQEMRSPDPVIRSHLYAAAENRAMQQSPINRRIEVALFCIAAIAQDTAAIDRTLARIAQTKGGALTAAPKVTPFLNGQIVDGRPQEWLPHLHPLSIEMTYALLEREANKGLR